MSLFDWINPVSLIGKMYDDPSKGANKILGQVPDLLKKYYEPYQQLGQRTLPTLEEQYGKLLNNPEELINKISQGYTKSPGYQFNYDQAMEGAGNAAAAGGYTGSPEDEQFRAKIGSGMASQDFNSYLSNALKNYFSGLEGTQGLQTQGYGATTNLADSLANVMGGQSKLKYEGTAGRNQFVNNIIGGGIKAAGTAMGGI